MTGSAIMAFASKTPRVSVIIPCYKTSEYIAETIGSVFGQTFQNFEVVVVNDGSPDTEELERALVPWADRIVYLKTKNHGVAEARNIGIRTAKGDLIAFLDSDDIWEPNCLEVQVRKLDENPFADIVYPHYMSFAENGGSSAIGSPSRGEVTFISLMRQTCIIITSGVLARRAALERVGLFDSDKSLQGSEDFDLWLRCLKNGSRIIYHNEVLLRYRRRPGSLSEDPARICRSARNVLIKMRTAVRTTPEENQIVENEIRRFEGERLFFEGKRAFLAGDIPCAVAHLRRANALLHKTRLSMILLIVGAMPRFARDVYLWRLRWRQRRKTLF